MTVALTAPISRRSSERYNRREDEEKVEGGMCMAMELRKKATLGELIAAVTEEVSRATRGSASTNILVSRIVRDLFTTRRVRLKRRRVIKFA